MTERDKAEEIQQRLERAARDGFWASNLVPPDIEWVLHALSLSEKRAEAAEHELRARRECDAGTGNCINLFMTAVAERDEARASLARVVEALRQNIGTLEWTVDRCVHWGKAHGELDTAIEQSRSALHRSQGD